MLLWNSIFTGPSETALGLTLYIFWVFPDGSEGKESACSAGDIRDMGSFPRLGRSPGEGNGNSFQYSCMITQRSLVGYSRKGCKGSDTTKQLSTQTYI